MIRGAKSIAQNVAVCWVDEQRTLQWGTLRLFSRSDDVLMLAALPPD